MNDLKPPCVLVADDDGFARRVMGDLLREMGYEVAEAFDGVSALETARRISPDLILADIVMPRLDGVELVKALRAEKRFDATPVLLVTGSMPRRLLSECIGAGADDLLFKDRMDAELAPRVWALLRSSRMARRLAREREWLDAALQVARATSRSLELDEVLRAAVRAVGDRLGAARCSLLVVDQEASPGRAVLVADRDEGSLRGLPVELYKYPELQAALSQRDLVVVEDAPGNPLLPEAARKLLGERGIQSLLVVPLVTRGTGVGAIFLKIARARPFSEDDLDFCRVVAAATANAVHNSWLYQRVKRERGELEWKHAEKERRLADANAALLRALRDKDETVALCAHDLRGPLAVIRGQSRRLVAHVAGIEARDRRALEAIDRQSARCAEIIDELLLRRAATLEARVDEVDLVALLEKVAEAHQEAAANGELVLKLDAPESLPWRADAGLLERAVGNILDNAVRHTPPGGEVVVKLCLDASGNAVFEIADSGPGLEEGALPRIFEPGQQGAGQHGALGLGLAFSREIAARHGGTLSARNGARGAIFTLTLPPRGAGTLPDDRAFLTHLAEELARATATGAPVSVVMAAIPEGRASATDATSALADAAARTLPAGSFVARLGAGRLGAILPGVQAPAARAFARRLAAHAPGAEIGTATSAGGDLQDPALLAATAEANLGTLRPRILVVDDEPAICELLDAFFSASGRFEVVTARDGRDAIEKAREFPPDLALLDLELPDMDGGAVLKRLRDTLGDLPAVACTGKQPTDPLLASGFERFFRKPLDMQQLVTEIETVLKQRRA